MKTFNLQMNASETMKCLFMLFALISSPLITSCGSNNPFAEPSASEGTTKKAKGSGTPDTNPSAGVAVATLQDIADCTSATANVLYYVTSESKFYYCTDAGDLNELSSLKGSTGTTGTTGATGADGDGYTLADLSVLTATEITSVASNNTGTNQFAAGTGAAAPSNVTNAVDAADAAIADPTAYATATAGLATGWGCYSFDMGPVLGGAAFGFGMVYAKVGILVSATTATINLRFESSGSGAAGSYLLGSTETVVGTTTEKIIYPSTTFFGRYLSYCVQGNASRNHILRIYQLYFRKA